MAPNKKQENDRPAGQILGRVVPEDFVGRADALARLVDQASNGKEGEGMLVLYAPFAGVSELLRQTYDHLFQEHKEVIPIYFSLRQEEKTGRTAAYHFVQSFLTQLVAFRRKENWLVHSTLGQSDLLDLVPPGDFDWVDQLMKSVNSEAESRDERLFIRTCLSAPARASKHGARTYVMLDSLEHADGLESETNLAIEFVRSIAQPGYPYVLAGLRRFVLDTVHDARNGFDRAAVLSLDALIEQRAAELVDRTARQYEVEVSESTRDLLVQQTGGSPASLDSLLRAAREKNVSLTSFLEAQKLYLDQVLGGELFRHCSRILGAIAANTSERRTVVQLLHESTLTESNKAPVEIWRRKLGVDPHRLQQVLRGVHINELSTVGAGYVDTTALPVIWRDYLRTQYRLEVSGEPRALVVSDTLAEMLKRAPQTMARHYRRESSLPLRNLLEQFDCQRVPASLFSYDGFSRAYKGMEADRINAALDAETELLRLPQIVHVASARAFNPTGLTDLEDERAVVARGFDAANYSDASEVVWLAAEIDSKLEVGRGLTEMWCDKLGHFARSCGFQRVRIWLVSPEGFSPEASALLAEREAYSSSQHQIEFLGYRVTASSIRGTEEAERDEFELAIPIGPDSELVAARTVEQIARRVPFDRESINQIKTAVIEASINAKEHSLSPERKIYHRFRVESDRLIVTIASRGVLPAGIFADNGSSADASSLGIESTKDRRGWGLKLIRTLMDEVEFERVDDGTRLRMTKYIKPKSV